MNLSSLLQFRDEWARFKARHPKFSPFLKAAYTRALREDSVISLKVTAPDGTEVASNLKVKKEDLELLSRIMNSLFLITHHALCLLMIRFSFYNPETPVNLFQQNHAHQLVWKGQARKADLRVRTV